MSEHKITDMRAYHRRTLTNRMLGRRRPVTEANLGSVGNFYKVPLPVHQNTVSVPLNLNSTRKRSNSTQKRSQASSNRLRSSNTPSTLRDLERERKTELCKLLREMDAPTFHDQNSRTWVALRAIRYLTQAIETKYPTKIFTKPYIYYKQISDYIIHTVFDQEKEIDVSYLKELAKDIGLYKKCRLTR